MQLGRAHAAAVRHADRQRERHRPARPPAVAADVVDELVERRVAERVVLHLDDRAPAGHAQADGRAEDPRLGERRVDAAIDAEPLLQPRGRAEDAAELADVLAHHHAPTRRAPSRRGARRSPPRRGGAQPRRESSGARRDRAPATAAARRRRARRRAPDPRAARPPRRRSRRASSSSASALTASACVFGEDAEPSEIALEAPDALVLPLLLDALGVDVDRRIVRGRMRRGAVGDGLDERRAVAGARSLDGLARRLVDREHVASVDPDAGHPVADRLVGEASARPSAPRAASRSPTGCCCRRGSTGRLHDAREGRALVHGTLGGRAVAEVRDRDPVLALQPRAPRVADRVRDVRPDRNADRRDVVLLAGSTSPSDARATS